MGLDFGLGKGTVPDADFVDDPIEIITTRLGIPDSSQFVLSIYLPPKESRSILEDIARSNLGLSLPSLPETRGQVRRQADRHSGSHTHLGLEVDGAVMLLDDDRVARREI